MQIHSVVKTFLHKKIADHPGYSLRVLARDLGISASFLSRMLSGKKPIPRRLLIEMSERLDIDGEIVAQFAIEAIDKDARSSKASELIEPEAQVHSALEGWQPASKVQFRAFSQWFYFPILHCINLSDYDGTLEFISRRLGLSPTTTEVAIRDLLAVGLLQQHDGQLRLAQKKIRLGTNKSQADVRRFHHQMMCKAQETLRDKTSPEDFSKRLITGITVTASPEDIALAKVKLNECLHEIANLLTNKSGTEVYHLGTQFFPLTAND